MEKLKSIALLLLALVLSTGATLTLRHVFPPMMLGVDVHAKEVP